MVSRTIRFEIFKRDFFTCQYCGRKPPEVVLQIDHVVPVSKAGSNEEYNLLTACFDCNSGKSDKTLTARPIDLGARIALIEERAAQVEAYEALLREERERIDLIVDEVISIYEKAFEEPDGTSWTLKDSVRPSIRRFLSRLPPSLVKEAMEIACARQNNGSAFRYFCGICWKRIKGEDTAP